MRNRFLPLLTIMVATAIAVTDSVAQSGYELPQDSISTLKLSEPIPSWGQLGGITIDRSNFLYVANFSNELWRITPDGEVKLMASNLYGASGNAVDSHGDILQSNFFGHTITKLDRDGNTTPFVTEGLNGPVGIVMDPDDNAYVVNCPGNYVAKVTPAGKATKFSEGDLFNCPNSIVRRADGELLVANFATNDIISIDADGNASVAYTINSGGADGNAHLALAKGNLYVTRIKDNVLYKVTPEGETTLIAGNGSNGNTDGPGSSATFLAPNGIVSDATGQFLYLNTLNEGWGSGKPTEVLVRKVKLVSLTDILVTAAEGGDTATMEEAYRAYKTSPAGSTQNTVVEAITQGFAFLRERRGALALKLFELNAESYPNVAAAVYNMAEGYRFAGRTDDAKRGYERTLEVDPNHAQAKAKLAAMTP